MVWLMPEDSLKALQNNAEEDIRVTGKPTVDLVVKIAKALEKNTKCMFLNFFHCGLKSVGSKALGEALEKNSTLKELYLSDNQIGDEGCKALGEALKKNTKLEKFILYSNEIGDVGCKALGEALEKNSTLKELDLSDNLIGDTGTKSLGEALEKNSNLKELELYNNQIGDIGATALAEGLQKNFTLEKLGLIDNSFEEVGAKAFSEALLINSSLQDLRLSSRFNCDITALSKSYLLSPASLTVFLPKSCITLEALRGVFHTALQINPERVYSRLVSCCKRSEELRPLLLQVEAYRKVRLLSRFKAKALPRELLVFTLKYLLE